MTPEQIEIERKKFEECFIKSHPELMRMSPNTLRIVDGEYINEVAHYKLLGWLACCESRDSLCVTLPKEWLSVDDSVTPDLNKWYRADIVQKRLKSAGINYRVEE
jgi:hypothetical protein